MSFSAQTCLTYTGTTPLGGTINVYTDLDYSNPLSSVTLSQITSPNCPFTFILPDGATTLRLLDTLTFCYVDIPVSSNNLCSICDLNFTSLVSDSIGKISAGLLTGSCDASITDYVINWYGPDSTTTIAFTSGLGTLFSGYNYTHPLTGITSIPVLEGVYVPEIDKVELNGVVFSSTGGSGNVLAELDCFSAITVSGYNCSNGTEPPGSDYTHRIQFSGNSGSGVVPIPLLSSFNLTGTTNYFAFSFKGETVPDRLTIQYSGQNYSQLITLEDIEVGSALPISNTNYSIFPKSADTSNYISKVICMTGFTQSSFDELILKVTPSNNPQTNWDFYFTCLDTFDCSTGCLETPQKIILSSITSTDIGCNTNRVRFRVSGCSDVNSLDLYKYYTKNDFFLGSFPFSGNTTLGLDFNTGRTNCGIFGYNTGSVYQCNNSPANSISFSKYISGGTGEITISGNNLSDLNAYYSSYLSTSALTQGFFSNDPNEIEHYKYFQLSIPQTSGSQFCGDGTPRIDYYIHLSSVVTTAATGSDWTMTITMPIITATTHFLCCEYTLTMSLGTTATTVDFFNCAGTATTTTFLLGGTSSATTKFFADETYGSIVLSSTGGTQTLSGECCDNCHGNAVTVKNTINSSSTGTSNNYSSFSTVGSRYVNPFVYNWQVIETTSPSTATTSNSFFNQNDYLSKMIPASGSPLTLIPSLSSQTCDLSSFMTYRDFGNYDYWTRYTFYYTLKLLDATNPWDFEVLASPIDSFGVYSGYPGSPIYLTAFTYTSGVGVTYSSSTFCI